MYYNLVYLFSKDKLPNPLYRGLDQKIAEI